MSGKTQSRAQLTRYLLGLVSPSERERLESEYFTNDDTFQEILSVEDDLIDAYARGELSATERRHFEERFLNSAASRERVQFARTLAGFIGDTPSSEDPAPYRPGFFASLRLAPMALRFAGVALLVLVPATIWLAIQQGRLRNELQTLRAERDTLDQKNDELRQSADADRTRNAESTAQIEKLQQELAVKAEPENRSGEAKPNIPRRSGTRPPQQVTADAKIGNRFEPQTVTQLPASSIFDLTPGTVRSEGGRANTFTVPKDAKFVGLRVNLENAGAEYYRAFIETADGEPVRWFDRFKSTSSTSVQLPAIPTSELPAGVYVLSLQAQQRDGSFLKVADYSFTIKRTE
ncbi:MAG TPA: hypothetical protein VE980_23880 [Pyrinomonadaceae bacterium]|nr:hypothetical protein [Pyrinomonadaceae bacterium]